MKRILHKAHETFLAKPPFPPQKKKNTKVREIYK